MELLLMKDKRIAAVIAFLFGWSGLHWLYLQRKLLTIIFIAIDAFILKTGFWQIWIFLGWISWINALRFATMGWHEFNIKYNRKE